MTARSANKADRLFVRNGRRLYRRAFSLVEPRIGVLIIMVLASILYWVAWRGAHPDPNLFKLDTDLAQAGAGAAADRGVVPASLAVAGWSEGDVSQFDSDNLYVKINGREGYYKAFGFERLYFVSIQNDVDATIAVDIELYDLGNSANAVGAYAGERSENIEPEVGELGFAHFDRNALYLTRGRYYMRAIGSEESPAVRAELEHIRARAEADLPGDALPWGFALFVGKLGMPAGAVDYARENAFSFGFASNVYWVTLDDDTELFVTPAGDDGAARVLAEQYREGFMQYGAADGDFVKDRHLGTLAGVAAAGPWVVGFRGATDADAAVAARDRLADAVGDFPLPAESGEPAAAGDVEEEYSDEY